MAGEGVGSSGRIFDPICGKKIEAAANQVKLTAEYKKRRYFFCSEKCRHTFEQQAERFRLNELARAGALFTPKQVRWWLA